MTNLLLDSGMTFCKGHKYRGYISNDFIQRKTLNFVLIQRKTLNFFMHYSDDHGIFIMWVNAYKILSKKRNIGLQNSQLTQLKDDGRALNVQDLASVYFVGGTSLSSPSESSCDCVKGLAYDSDIVPFVWLLTLLGPETHRSVTSLRIRLPQPLRRVFFDIFIQEDLLDQVAYLILDLIAFLSMTLP